MKKLIIPLLFLVTLIVACNDGGKKGPEKGSISVDTLSGATVLDTCNLDDTVKIPTDLCGSSGSGNFVIDPVLAQKYIAAFDSKYVRQGTGLEKEYWVSKCDIEALNNFFRNNNKYDGAWITYTSDQAPSYKSSINFVPSIYKIKDKQRHEPQWAAVSDIVPPAACTLSAYFSTSNVKAGQFRQIHRKEGTGGLVNLLSRRVWVDTCVFYSLYKIIQAYSSSNTPMDGMFVYSAAYNSAPAYQPYGYLGKDHATLILVLSYTCSQIDGHFPAWDVNKYLYNKLVKNAVGAAAPAFNHGELCPNACTDLD